MDSDGKMHVVLAGFLFQIMCPISNFQLSLIFDKDNVMMKIYFDYLCFNNNILFD